MERLKLAEAHIEELEHDRTTTIEDLRLEMDDAWAHAEQVEVKLRESEGECEGLQGRLRHLG